MGYSVQMRSDAMIGCTLKELVDNVVNKLFGALADVSHVHTVSKNEGTVYLMVFNKYYVRAKDYISLSLMMTVADDGYEATIICYEPAAQLIEMIWRADDDFVECVEETLQGFGFITVSRDKIV